MVHIINQLNYPAPNLTLLKTVSQIVFELHIVYEGYSGPDRIWPKSLLDFLTWKEER